MEKQNLNENKNSVLDGTDSLLTYDERVKLSLKTKWKITTCRAGEVCQCRLIVPETEIYDKDGNEIYIVGSGCMPKEYAEHVVKLHNESLNVICE